MTRKTLYNYMMCILCMAFIVICATIGYRMHHPRSFPQLVRVYHTGINMNKHTSVQLPYCTLDIGLSSDSTRLFQTCDNINHTYEHDTP